MNMTTFIKINILYRYFETGNVFMLYVPITI